MAVQQAPTAGAQQSTDLFADVSAQKASDQELEQAEGGLGQFIRKVAQASNTPAGRSVIKKVVNAIVKAATYVAVKIAGSQEKLH